MTDAAKSLIWTDVDYKRGGKQVAWPNLPHSATRSAYGVIRIPVCVVQNGSGATILLHCLFHLATDRPAPRARRHREPHGAAA